MPLLTNIIEIAADREAVFAFVSDLRNETHWNPECRSITKLSDGPVGLGTRYRANWKGSPELIVECVAFDAPHSWTNVNGGPISIRSTFTIEASPAGSVVNGGPISIRSTFTIEASPAGSVLHSTFAVEGHGIGRVLAPAFARKMSRVIPEHLATIKTILESAHVQR